VYSFNVVGLKSDSGCYLVIHFSLEWKLFASNNTIQKWNRIEFRILQGGKMSTFLYFICYMYRISILFLKHINICYVPHREFLRGLSLKIHSRQIYVTSNVIFSLGKVQTYISVLLSRLCALFIHLNQWFRKCLLLV
jgi:hypothetical protein